MSESGQRGRVVRALRALDAVPVENAVRSGTPDVNCAGDNWIELKWLRRWPARKSSIVRLDHFTKGQRMWLKRRAKAGGKTWLLLQCKAEWLLFHGQTAAECVGLVSREELVRRCAVHWTHGLVDKELETCMVMDWGIWNGSPMVRPSSYPVDDLKSLNWKLLENAE